MLSFQGSTERIISHPVRISTYLDGALPCLEVEVEGEKPIKVHVHQPLALGKALVDMANPVTVPRPTSAPL